MGSHSVTKIVRAAAIAGFALVFATQTAAAATPSRVLATTSNPFAGCTIGSGPPEWGTVNYPNAEVEPMVAVNPQNHRNIIGVAQQDRWNDGGAHGLVAMYSKDGGNSFHVVPLPFSSCAPGGLPYERASDPWVSFGPDGTAYAVSISFDENTQRGDVAAATSTDGGKTWGNLTELITDTDFFNDKESVTADPTTPGTAYAVWDRAPYCCSFPGPSWMSKTTDFGVTWSTPQQITPTNPNTADLGNVIVIDPNTGTLYDFLDRFYESSGLARYVVIKSTDGGANWSGPVVIARDLGIQTTGSTSGRPGRQRRLGNHQRRDRPSHWPPICGLAGRAVHRRGTQPDRDLDFSRWVALERAIRGQHDCRAGRLHGDCRGQRRRPGRGHLLRLPQLRPEQGGLANELLDAHLSGARQAMGPGHPDARQALQHSQGA